MIKGDTILGQSIKSDTIKRYVSAAAELFTDRWGNMADPYECKTLRRNYPKILISALARYEKVPNRREIITHDMFEHIAKQADRAGPDSLVASFKDWLSWSRYGGPRQGEWSQEKSKTKYKEVEGIAGEAQAFRLDDLAFYDHNSRGIDPRDTLICNVAYATVRWRYQKNKDNGEIIKYYVDSRGNRWCPVYALLSIAQRAIRMNIPSNEPIAKYNQGTKQYFITAKNVATILQEAAYETMGITDPKVLQKWTSHSLRVTAANELHRMGFSDAYIKHRLRWRSDAFMKYLRHTIHVARKHTEALSLTNKNLQLEKSNLDRVNDRIDGIQLHRCRDENDILWRQYFYAKESTVV